MAAAPSAPCQVESAYYCIRVEHDIQKPSGRILWLDDLMHSYVDLDDPTYLEFDYVKSFSDAVAVAWPQAQALDALHIGGGGFTLPRYLAAEYPGTKSTVLEIDPTVLKIGRERLGLRTSKALRVRIGDARIGIRDRPDDSADLVVGDAFGSLSVPWHLSTREFVEDIHRVLRPGGLYIANVIDYPPFRFARAELATFREQFDYVAVIAPQSVFDGIYGGNLVLVASDRALDRAALEQRATRARRRRARGRGARPLRGQRTGDPRRLRADRPVAGRRPELVEDSEMGTVVVDLSVSLDGFIAGADDGAELPLGRGGEALFTWMSAGPESNQVEARLTPPDASKVVIDEWMTEVGAMISGRRTFDIAGGWKDGHPIDAPIFVVTHEPRPTVNGARRSRS